MPDTTDIQNIITLALAALGALYALAVSIVKLTPTHADDAWLETCNMWIALLCTIFGLTTNQGRTIKK